MTLERTIFVCHSRESGNLNLKLALALNGLPGHGKKQSTISFLRFIVIRIIFPVIAMKGCFFAGQCRESGILYFGTGLWTERIKN